MSILLNEQELELQSTVQALCADQSVGREARRLLDAPGKYDDALWKRISREMDLVGLAAPGSAGGSDAGYQTRGVVLTELGARLVPSPYFATAVLAVDVLAGIDSDPARVVLGRLVAGTATATVAASEAGTVAWPASSLATEASQAPGGWTLTGRKSLVVDGATATYLIVTASSASDGRLGFYLVEAESPGVDRIPSGGVDGSRPLATVQFSAAPAVPLPAADAARLLEHVRDLASLALCAELVGAQRHCIEMTVAYAKVRYQFGRAIGSFQAVKHRIADMYTRYELSLASVRRGLSIADGHEPDPNGQALPIAASTAHAEIARYFRWTADDTIHVHGGIGFTWEHDAHLYLRRAVSSEWLLGPPSYYQDRLAGLLAL
jgi:alkylation response protein AidB-like acyl-CoA dehydrogenase